MEPYWIVINVVEKRGGNISVLDTEQDAIDQFNHYFKENEKFTTEYRFIKILNRAGNSYRVENGKLALKHYDA